MLGEVKATGAVMKLGLDERVTAIEGMILTDLGTEVGSKKTDQDAVRFVVGTLRIYPTRLLVLIAVRHSVCDRRSLHTII